MSLYKVKYSYLVLLLFVFISKANASNNIDLNNLLYKSYKNISSIAIVSYDIKIITIEAKNITNTNSGRVTDIWDEDSHYSLSKLKNKHLIFFYVNSLGIARFWSGRVNNLPEIKAKDINQKIFSSAISYNTLVINPFWVNVPVNYRIDQGFIVLQCYTKNRYSIFNKVEIYLNKDNMPVRTLYYNNISNFPIAEALITDYKKENNKFFIYKTEFRDNAKKKITIIERSNIVVETELPPWFSKAKELINDNINNYKKSFMISLRSKDEIQNLLINSKKKDFIILDPECDNEKKYSKKEEEVIIPSLPLKENSKIDSLNYTESKINRNNETNKSRNDLLLKALDNLDDIPNQNQLTKDNIVKNKDIPLNKENTKTDIKSKSQLSKPKLEDKVKSYNKSNKLKEIPKKIPHNAPKESKNNIPPNVVENKSNKSLEETKNVEDKKESIPTPKAQEEKPVSSQNKENNLQDSNKKSKLKLNNLF